MGGGSREPTSAAKPRLTVGVAAQVGVLVAVMVMGLFVGQDWTHRLFSGVLFPVGIVGVVARAGLAAYHSRLPRWTQIVLALVLVAVSVPVGLFGERLQVAGLVWVFVVPALFPGALPGRLQASLQRRAAQSAADPGDAAPGVSRKLLVNSAIVAVLVVVGVVAMILFVPGTREVPRAMEGDTPQRTLEELPEPAWSDLDAAIEATLAHGSAHLRYRQHLDGEVRQVGVGRIDFDEHVATIGLAGTRQVFIDDQVLLRWHDDDRWVRVAVDEVSDARGEPVPGEASPWGQLELVARADDARRLGVTEVSGIELAQIGATADVSATRDTIAHELRETIEQYRDAPEAFDGGFVDLGTLEATLAELETHDGRLPIEVWIDADQRIWRISYDLADWTEPPDGQPAELSTFALDLRGFGSAGVIRPPDEDDIVDIDNLDDTDLPFSVP